MKNIFQYAQFKVKHSGVSSFKALIFAVAFVSSAALSASAGAAESEGTFVVIIGAPGSGKSTVSDYLRSSEGVPIIEVGQLLAAKIEEASRSTARGRPGSQRTRSASRRNRNIERARDQLEAGELVEGQALDAVVAAAVLAPDATGGFILDGYPGTWTQAEFLDGLLDARGIVPTVLYLDITDELALERMEGRGRADDLSGFDETRLEIFRNNIAPLLEFYEGSDMYTIDASQSIAEVRAQVDELLD